VDAGMGIRLAAGRGRAARRRGGSGRRWRDGGGGASAARAHDQHSGEHTGERKGVRDCRVVEAHV